jgi:hypothetical protein
MSEESSQNHIPFTEPVPVKTIQGAEYSESVSPGGLIVLKETKAATRMNAVATYVPPAKPAYSSFVLGGKVSTTDKEFWKVKMNLLSPEARVIFNKEF